MKKKTGNSKLLDAEAAVEDYLGMLLRQATETPSATDSVAVRDNVVLLPDIPLAPEGMNEMSQVKESEPYAPLAASDEPGISDKGGKEEIVQSISTSGRLVSLARSKACLASSGSLR